MSDGRRVSLYPLNNGKGGIESIQLLYDFIFMLHFMDYGKAGGFNNTQIMLFAFITLWLSLTRFIWTIDLGLRGHYKLSLLKVKK